MRSMSSAKKKIKIKIDTPGCLMDDTSGMAGSIGVVRLSSVYKIFFLFLIDTASVAKYVRCPSKAQGPPGLPSQVSHTFLLAMHGIAFGCLSEVRVPVASQRTGRVESDLFLFVWGVIRPGPGKQRAGKRTICWPKGCGVVMEKTTRDINKDWEI